MGLTESVTIIALNSLTVIAFCRDRNLRKRSTCLVISLAVADMLSGGTAPFDLFDNMYMRCATSGGTIQSIGIRYQRSYSSGFSVAR